MKKEIIKLIRKAERDYNVKILWAVESGSRAWGFSSKDSDYDIRCMHIGKIDNYLGLEPPPKQINLITNVLDLESWDIKKFAEFTLKSNPQIAEWLRSPIIYIDSPIRKYFKEYFDQGCSLEFLRQHYIRMAKQNYQKYLSNSMHYSCKKYLYVLRGIACAIYIKKEKRLPPLHYKDVITYLPDYAQSFFNKCIIQKNKTEKAEISVDERISYLINNLINEKFIKVDTKFRKVKELNAYLIKLLKNSQH